MFWIAAQASYSQLVPEAENEGWTFSRYLTAAFRSLGGEFPDAARSQHDDSSAPASVSSFSCRASGGGYESQLVFQATILRR